MIPADVASSLRQILPDSQQLAQTQNQPVAALQKLADVLSNLVPGQRIMAEIQAMLPNGTYRAVVAQRDITLSLPFSAKAGDSLELEVVETDGKVALAFVANRSTGQEAPVQQNESASTTLSQTGKLIGNLMGNIDDQGKRAAPAALNGNQPLVEDFPAQAANLAPILKDALTKSGVFYEAHQARWVAGEMPTEALRQEPQGKMPPTVAPAAVDRSPEAKFADTGKAEVAAINLPTSSRPVESPAPSNPLNQSNPASQSPQPTSGGSPIPQNLTPIVQQQLDALATQNYAWQGQIWPGQQMSWEIAADSEGGRNTDAETATRWQTRLKLSLPMLGGIDATLRLRPGGELAITMTADSENTETRLRDSSVALRKQLEAAGLNLTQILVQHGETAE